MKKLRLVSIVVFSLAAGVSMAVKFNIDYGVQNELSVHNIEALANGEGSGGGCYGVGSLVCDHGKYYGRYY